MQDQDYNEETEQQIVPKPKAKPGSYPSMLFEERPIIEIADRLRKKYLVFRVYEDPIHLRPYPPPDRGYYFDMHKCDIKIIRYTLEDNGFRELPSVKELMQNGGSSL